MHKHLNKIFETGQMTDQNGNIHALHSNISIEEGLYTQEVIRDIKPRISLEVGLAMGISSMFICEALKEINSNRHIIIDPGQITSALSGDNWSGLGLYNLSKCGYDDIIDFKSDHSEYALPKLVEQGLKIDFAFIDGWHTFDHTMLDFFYINRMLNIGGVVVFDDAQMPSINKLINYVLNYPSYKPYYLESKIRSDNIDNRWTGSNIFEKLIKKPYRVPILMYKTIAEKSRIGARFLSSKYIFGMKNHQVLSKRYYAIQKISEDNRLWNWYENF